MSTLKNTLRLVAVGRQFSQSAVKNAGTVPEGYAKIKNVQASFQKPDGLPVHLKKGFTDQALLGITTVLCLVGLANIGVLIYELSNPPKLN